MTGTTSDTELYARLGKNRRSVLCGALNRDTGTGCGAPLGQRIKWNDHHQVWLPPDRAMNYSTETWELSQRAIRRGRAGHQPFASRELVKEFMSAFEPTGGPVGILPYLPARIRCRCGQMQWLDGERLEVGNELWAVTRMSFHPWAGAMYEITNEVDLRWWKRYVQSTR